MVATFEENMEQLDKIVQSLEEGDTTLEQSLKSFESGIKISRACFKELTKAEKKVEMLIKQNGEVVGREEIEK